MIIEVGKYVLDCDVAATVVAFAAYTPYECGCDGCRNFRVAGPVAFFPILGLFQKFGIDRAKPAEVFHVGPPDDELILQYEGWFHFIGRMISDGDIVNVSSNSKMYFVSRPALIPPSFEGQPLVQMEFELRAPWLLPEPWKP